MSHPPDPRHAGCVFEIDPAVLEPVGDEAGADSVLFLQPAGEVFTDPREDPVAGRPPARLPEVELGVLRVVGEVEDDVGAAVMRARAFFRDGRGAVDEPLCRDGARYVCAEFMRLSDGRP
ncbi:MAG: hypothetical protein PWQ69_1542 [Methanomicrobiaceae archaeon]|nr:hypothetical protein [Methanomicrobiaceae archaeon]